MNFSMKAVVESGDLNRHYMGEMFGAEIQLFKSSITEIGYDKIYNKSISSGKRIVSIHTPLGGGRSMNIEDILDDDIYDDFEFVMKLANEISEYQGTDKIPVVIHTEVDSIGKGFFNHLMDEVSNKINHLMKKYPKSGIALENTMIFKNYKDFPIFTNATENTISVYNALKERSDYPERLGTVIDNCHVNLNDKLLAILQGININVSKMSRTEDYFKIAGPDCDIVHLSDCIGLGYEDYNHGIGHKDNPSSRERLKTTLLQIKRYCPKAEVVIEVTEEDYENRPDAMETFRLAKKILKEIE